VAQLRTLASTRYGPALSAYLSNIVQPDPALLTDLSLATGMRVSQWQSHFNMGPDYVRANLVASTLLGRYDSRITLPSQAPNSNIDPSDELIGTSFAFRITEYLAALGYTTPSSYTLLSQAIQTWRFSHDGNSLPDTIPDLASAMTQNPRLKVLAVNGYHDLATPFFTTENDLARLGSNPNVTVRNYMGGHMTYLDDGSRPQMKADLAAFYRSALGN
jgi:carboxypeptidase C (cathepsin A)